MDEEKKIPSCNNSALPSTFGSNLQKRCQITILSKVNYSQDSDLALFWKIWTKVKIFWDYATFNVQWFNISVLDSNTSLQIEHLVLLKVLTLLHLVAICFFNSESLLKILPHSEQVESFFRSRLLWTRLLALFSLKVG